MKTTNSAPKASKGQQNRVRWRLAYTLLNNPSLLPYRKGTLVDATANGTKASHPKPWWNWQGFFETMDSHQEVTDGFHHQFSSGVLQLLLHASFGLMPLPWPVCRLRKWGLVVLLSFPIPPHPRTNSSWWAWNPKQSFGIDPKLVFFSV